MKNLIMLLVVGVVVTCQAQLLGRNRMRSQAGVRRTALLNDAEKFRQTYPAGTNEWGRTYEEQQDYKRFFKSFPTGTNYCGQTWQEVQSEKKKFKMEETKFEKAYPSGTNEFGRTFVEQHNFECFLRWNPSGTNAHGRTWQEQNKYERNKEYLIKSYSPGVVTRRTLFGGVPAFGPAYVLGMTVGTVPTNCVANIVLKPFLSMSSEVELLEESKKTWEAGNGIVTIAVCVGESCPPLDNARVRGSRLRTIYRDFTYSSDGRLIKISEPYVVEPKLIVEDSNATLLKGKGR